ncbi:hypothetical protein BDD43_4256 [Mucilaginibacter gracilis]|uniref:Uncharacterized protein n=1 Tax=Mucilaginibacter gracilis TaxID=423350 RepID=A0A495J6I8_9SPHI|nr:hypothetical protein BDD43_4256 [Mucilaginibacter gracilis]
MDMSKTDYAERAMNGGVEIGLNNQRIVPFDQKLDDGSEVAW